MSDSNLYSLECEKHALSGLFHNKNVLPEIDPFVKDVDFSNNTHQTIYLIARQMIASNEQFDKVLLANKITNLGIKFHGDIDIYQYIESLFYSKPDKKSTVEAYKNLVTYRARRDILQNLRGLAEFIKKPGDKSLSEILAHCDNSYSEKMRELLQYTDKQSINIFDQLAEKTEYLAEHPEKQKEFMMGPFDSINRIWGSISRPGNITVIGARSGVGKTSLGLFYNIWLAEKYGVPILHCDNGEMSIEELQHRAICLLTGGKVPLWAIEQNKWHENNEWKNLVREAYPRMKKLKMFYEPVNRLSPAETIRLIRQYSYKLGRENTFIVNFDYLKGFTDDHNTPEWKLMDEFVQDIKSFIVNEVQIPFWTSIQLNRSGVSTNRKASEVVDDESAFGISDRVLQQSSFSLLLRYKVMEEMEAESGLFGNMKMDVLKRRFLGVEYQKAINPVRSYDGKYRRNYINLQSESFCFKDCGDLHDMEKVLTGKFKNPEQNAGNETPI